MFLFDFFEDFGIVVTILVFVVIWYYLKMDMPPLLALLITIVITFMLVIPYDWFKYLVFVGLFMHGFWSWARKGWE
jgi:hypothetical protein